jgi:glycosyltransferase involved in cell wall biosynthesis
MAGETANPTVSVILPTHNRAHLLDRAIRSALDQSYKDFELIVIDDGSTDETEQVVRGFGDDRIVYLHHEENRGAAAARNTGLRAARGEYVAFLDSDGEWLPHKLDRQMKVLAEASPAVGVVYTDMWTVTREGRKQYWSSPRIMPEDGIIYHQAIDYGVSGINMQAAVIRKECFEKTGVFDEEFPRYIDVELFIRLSKHFHFHHIAEPLIIDHVTPGISSDGALLIEARKLILRKYRADIERNRKSLARHLYAIGTVLCQYGEIDEGRRHLLRSVRTYPFVLRHMVSALVWLLGERAYRIAARVKRTVQAACCDINAHADPANRQPHR